MCNTLYCSNYLRHPIQLLTCSELEGAGEGATMEPARGIHGNALARIVAHVHLLVDVGEEGEEARYSHHYGAGGLETTIVHDRSKKGILSYKFEYAFLY